jgi:hypothetical protein
MAENRPGCPLCASPEALSERGPDPDFSTVRCPACAPFVLFVPLPAQVWAHLPPGEWARWRAGLSAAVRRYWRQQALPLEINDGNWKALAVAGLRLLRE